MYEGTERGDRRAGERSSRGAASTASCATPSSWRRRRPKKHLTSATKSNGIAITMPYWDERVQGDGRELSRRARPTSTTSTSSPRTSCSIRTGSTSSSARICSATSSPTWARPCTGTIGIAPSANLNPEREFPSMFEPVHGSAPDIAGTGHRQSDRPDLVRRDDARPPRPPGRGRGGRARDRGGADRAARARRDIGGTAPTRSRSARRSPQRSPRRRR